MNKALIALAAIAALAGCGSSVEQPEQTVQQLMAEVVQPTTEIYWDSVQYISDEQGQHEILPETDADWKQTQDAAVRIQELGELLQTEGYAHDRGEDWIQISQSLVEVGKMAEQAAVDRDVDKVFEVGGTIYNVCTACHQVYPPAEGLPE
jgi:hypothetical protein